MPLRPMSAPAPAEASSVRGASRSGHALSTASASMRQSSTLSSAAASGAERAASTAQRAAASAHADQQGALLGIGYPSADPWGAAAQDAHAPAPSAAHAQARSTWGVLLKPEGSQVSCEVRGLMTQNATQSSLAPAGAPGSAPSMPQLKGAPWHGIPCPNASQGTNPSAFQGEVPAAAPLGSGAWAGPGPHAAPTQVAQHGMPPAAYGGIGALSGPPPARSPGSGSGRGVGALERAESQPPAASPAVSMAESLAELVARPRFISASHGHVHAKTLSCGHRLGPAPSKLGSPDAREDMIN